MFCPARKFRFDVPGRLVPDGHTVTYPPACGSTTVTVSTAAATSPPGAATCTATVPSAGTAPGICNPDRESAIRAAAGYTTVPDAVGVPDNVYPVTSTSTCTVPKE